MAICFDCARRRTPRLLYFTILVCVVLPALSDHTEVYFMDLFRVASLALSDHTIGRPVVKRIKRALLEHDGVWVPSRYFAIKSKASLLIHLHHQYLLLFLPLPHPHPLLSSTLPQPAARHPTLPKRCRWRVAGRHLDNRSALLSGFDPRAPKQRNSLVQLTQQ